MKMKAEALPQSKPKAEVPIASVPPRQLSSIVGVLAQEKTDADYSQVFPDMRSDIIAAVGELYDEVNDTYTAGRFLLFTRPYLGIFLDR